MAGAEIIIVGGGAIGLSVAYHLTAAGAADVLVLERNELTSGTSWHAAGIIGPLRATLNMTRLAGYAGELFRRLEAETGQATGFVTTGGLWLAQTPDRMRELASIAAVGESVGLAVTTIRSADVQARCPLLRVDDLSGALWVDEDGQANPVDVCMAYARGARDRGARIEQGARVCSVERADDRVKGVALADGRRLECGILINCAGAWSPVLHAMVDQPTPLQAVSHMYVVTEPIASLPNPFPIVRDLDAGIYLKGDAGRLVLGGFEADAKPLNVRDPGFDAAFVELPEDWEQFEPFMQAGVARISLLERAGIQHFMNGPEAFTADTRPLLGPVPGVEGYYIAAGFNSLGIVSSAGVGRTMAAWILDGRADIDAWELDVARLDGHAGTPSFLTDRMKEAVANQFDMHWPYKQPRTARGVCRTPLHHALEKQGAVFGAFAGWERPMWFAQNADEGELRYSNASQHWWPFAARESRAMTDGVALFDLTPFTKIDVAGDEALDALQYLCAGDMDIAPNRSRYTQMLNRHAGIEADVTVSRFGEHRWRIVSGAATRHKDLAWIRRQLAGYRVAVFDATSGEVVLGLMGPMSRRLLQRLSRSDLSGRALARGATAVVDVGMARVRVQRQSFVGELGFEIYCPVEVAAHVYECVVEAGTEIELLHAGMMCLDGCRLEKGYPHWGHDIGSHDTPLQAGLGAFVDWSKADRFLGGEALLAERERGVTRRRMLFEVPFDGDAPLLLHEQPILRDDGFVGMTTSGGVGPRTGKALAMGYVSCAAGESRRDLMAGAYAIGVAGERHVALPLPRAPFDPNGKRMRDNGDGE